MKTLIILLSLLLTTPLYCYDTIQIIPSLKGSQTWKQGTKIYQNLHLANYSGRLVLMVNELPENIKQHNISITPIYGITVLNFQLINQKKNQTKTISFTHLRENLNDLRDSLTLINSKEKEQLRLKRQLFSHANNARQLSQMQLIFKEKFTVLRKERLAILRKLQLTQQKLKQISPYINSDNAVGQNLYVNIKIETWAIKNLEISYFIPNEIENFNHPLEALNEKQKYSLFGRIIESKQRFPLVFAKIEYYYEKELLGATYTDEEGFFTLNLSQNGPYTLIIKQEGYKNRKLRKLYLNSHSQHQRTIRLKAKNPMSAIEILSFALPVLDIVQSHW